MTTQNYMQNSITDLTKQTCCPDFLNRFKHYDQVHLHNAGFRLQNIRPKSNPISILNQTQPLEALSLTNIQTQTCSN